MSKSYVYLSFSAYTSLVIGSIASDAWGGKGVLLLSLVLLVSPVVIKAQQNPDEGRNSDKPGVRRRHIIVSCILAFWLGAIFPILGEWWRVLYMGFIPLVVWLIRFYVSRPI